MLTHNEIQTLIDRIARQLNPQRIIVFGSYAKGTATPGSDLNLAIELNTVLPQRQRSRLLAALIAGYSVPIDAHIYTPAEIAAHSTVEFSFLHSVVTTGQVVYERSASRAGRG